MDELAECSSTALNHVAVLRYAGRYYRGKIKTLYEEVKRLQTALQHSEKKVGHVLETSLIQNVVNLNKGEYLFMLCPIPFPMQFARLHFIHIILKSEAVQPFFLIGGWWYEMFNFVISMEIHNLCKLCICWMDTLGASFRHL